MNQKNKKEVINKAKAPTKKRGRKPKAESKGVVKKRGRKPKEKVYTVIKADTTPNEQIEEHIILHLPITQEDIDKMDKNSLLGEQAESPIPFQPDINYSEVDKAISSNRVAVKEPINDELCQVDDGIEKKLVKRNLLNVMYTFIDGNNREEWPINTDIYCMWCCHPFNTMPCALPEKVVNERFYVFGNFCSFNCAASYNFDTSAYNVWERYSLLNLLYKKMYETMDKIKIKLAPPRSTLKIFGGFLSIEDFRKNFLINTSYNLVVPPMVSLVPKVEENIYEIASNNSYIPVDKEAIQDVELKLKREKPLTNPTNTLESYMSLKIV